jgi:hypothetical protein
MEHPALGSSFFRFPALIVGLDPRFLRTASLLLSPFATGRNPSTYRYRCYLKARRISDSSINLGFISFTFQALF